jgi:glutathione peroxidase
MSRYGKYAMINNLNFTKKAKQMNILKICIVSFVTFTFTAQAGDKMGTFYTYKATDIKGVERSMSEYKGKVVLVVNVASKCGFTPQYEGLQKLYEKYEKKGLVVLGFPSNQFRKQEPGSNAEIQNFCKVNYGVTFPLFAKIDVNGDATHPLFSFLKKEATGFLGTESIKWNFTKFLVDAKGNVLKRYGSSTKPASIEDDLKVLLERK